MQTTNMYNKECIAYYAECHRRICMTRLLFFCNTILEVHNRQACFKINQIYVTKTIHQKRYHWYIK